MLVQRFVNMETCFITPSVRAELVEADLMSFDKLRTNGVYFFTKRCTSAILICQRTLGLLLISQIDFEKHLNLLRTYLQTSFLYTMRQQYFQASRMAFGTFYRLAIPGNSVWVAWVHRGNKNRRMMWLSEHFQPG